MFPNVFVGVSSIRRDRQRLLYMVSDNIGSRRTASAPATVVPNSGAATAVTLTLLRPSEPCRSQGEGSRKGVEVRRLHAICGFDPRRQHLLLPVASTVNRILQSPMQWQHHRMLVMPQFANSAFPRQA